MRYFVLLAFWLFGSTAQAQQISAGLRAAGNFSLQRSGTKAGFKPMPGAKVSVAPEAFLRYQGRKSWAAEFALTTDRMQQQYWWAGSSELQSPAPSRMSFNTRSVEAAINLQYEVRCQRMASVQSLKNLHSYVGIGTSLSLMHQQGVVIAPNGEATSKNSEYWYHWISLSKTIRYDLNKHFSVQTDGQCGMNTMNMFRTVAAPEPSLRFSLKLGATYNW